MYAVRFSELAERTRRGLPLRGRLALTLAARKIAGDPFNVGRPYPAEGPTGRCLPFGSWGVAVYRVELTEVVVTVLDLAWAK